MKKSILKFDAPIAELLSRNGPSCALILLSFVINGWVSQPPASAQNLTDEWVEKAAAPLVENHVVDGLSVGYIEGKHWGIVHLGHSNRTKEKADNLTLYKIASISKVFTSLLLADAVVRGEIDLNSAADVPNSAGIRLPSRGGRSITWRDLSTHRSGLPRLPGNFYPLTDPRNPYRDYDSKKAAAFLNDYELPREPGDSREYSNFGVSVLGYLVSQKSDMSYQKLLRERIAKPLRMTDCTVSLSRDKKMRLATPHSQFGSATPPWTNADLPGAGGIHATMRDMMRFAKAHLSPPPRSPETGTLGEAINLAWKQQHDGGTSGRAMGLGWLIWPDGQTHWHNGRSGGFSSALYINRQSECAVVVLCNTAVADKMDELAIQLITKAAGQKVKSPLSSGGAGAGSGYAKKSPFTGVRWQAAQNDRELPEVQVEGQWYKLVSLDDLPAAEIVAFSQKTFAGKWKKRFEEDLVELLSRRGHPPQDTVRLVVQSLSSTETQVLEGVRMTEANRQAIKNALPTGTKAKPVSIDAAFRSRLVGRYQLAPGFVFTVSDQEGKLMVAATNQPTLEVFPDSPTRWSYREIDATLEFKLPKSGPAKRLILHQGGVKQTARRIESELTEAESNKLAVDAKLRGRLVGRYQLTPAFIFTVRDREGRLMVGITNQPTQEVFPDSPTRWSYRGIDATIEFKLTKSGPAKRLILHQNGAEQTARRMK